MSTNIFKGGLICINDLQSMDIVKREYYLFNFFTYVKTLGSFIFMLPSYLIQCHSNSKLNIHLCLNK